MIVIDRTRRRGTRPSVGERTARRENRNAVRSATDSSWSDEGETYRESDGDT